MTDFDNEPHQANDSICSFRECPTPDRQKESTCPQCKRNIKESKVIERDEIMPFFNEDEFNQIFEVV